MALFNTFRSHQLQSEVYSADCGWADHGKKSQIFYPWLAADTAVDTIPLGRAHGTLQTVYVPSSALLEDIKKLTDIGNFRKR